jgi:hypothetical protein
LLIAPTAHPRFLALLIMAAGNEKAHFLDKTFQLLYTVQTETANLIGLEIFKRSRLINSMKRYLKPTMGGKK